MKRLLSLLLTLAVLFSLVSCDIELDYTGDADSTVIIETNNWVDIEDDTEPQTEDSETCFEESVVENGHYTIKEEVALYIHLYGKLPPNFITKNQARALGWEGGSLEPYAKGKSIGGDRFGNYEKRLPAKSGRSYTECDINTMGADSRGAERIVFSNDGLVYYTPDHYETFELLYGEIS